MLSNLVDLLKAVQTSFFVLPDSFSCCGDPARILGEEDLFQQVVVKQIDIIKASGAKQILVHCPHCYTSLKERYPYLGAEFSVIHASEFLLEAISRGDLSFNGTASAGQTIAYHDPCFLGRYQELYQPPRKILKSLAGADLQELSRHGKEGFCCGAGGGHFFMDLDCGRRPSSLRLEEVLNQDPDILAVSCNFCFSMFDDALRRLPATAVLCIADWVELLSENIKK